LKDYEIKNFEEEINISLPEDYKSFLKIHNGAILFEMLLGTVNIGGGLHLYSVDEIK
jgi:cell wall assembly regulator SMI1